MNHGYETETDRIRKRLKQTLTPREQIANWWCYHKIPVLIGVMALIFVIYLIWEVTGTPAADYTVGWVAASYPDDETVEQISESLAQYGEDLNGDGQVCVQIHQMPLDLSASIGQDGANSESELANFMALKADLSSCQSVIFLTDAPEAFWNYSGILLYLDGTEPEPEAEDWENMVISWKTCPEFGGFPIDCDEIYLCCRACTQDSQRETWQQSWTLWEKLLAECK